jgi:probable HAF family extracellular repeat protein
MRSLQPTTLRRLARGLVAGAVLVTSLTAGTAAASGADVQAPRGPRSNTPVFVLENGRFTGFDTPGAAPQDIVGVNNRGQIVGGYKQDVAGDPPGRGFRGFLRAANGRITRIDVPRAAGTTPNGLNDRGEVVGYYSNSNSCVGCAGVSDKRGFLRDARGRYTTIHVPGAAETLAFGINNRRQVVGEYYDTDGGVHGFRWDRGRFTTFDGPRGAVRASVTDINDRGDMVGLYLDDLTLRPGTLHGFALQRGRYVTIDAPGAPYSFPRGINNHGQIVGYTQTDTPINDNTEVHGYLLRNGPRGRFTPIDVPGALGTAATDINDAGTIVGLYGNPNTASDPQPGDMTPTDVPGLLEGAAPA